ncbi:hypothetical protein COHA_006506 [Chlorella ohadii]|uniref:Uncharacterized protein n=1 Tax=Chlorella ohadii TaxID=2649997 RepID=A0AAD5DSL2_9CHLO|nr:hypothetical protein COHA_006506 [Chlorella ohadii]
MLTALPRAAAQRAFVGTAGARLSQRRLAMAVRASSSSAPDDISDNGQVSILVVRGTNLVQEACQRHKTSPTASAALGRALLGTLLMGAFRDEGERTQVTFKGDGPLGGIQVIADARGTVKGKVGNPAADPPLRPDGKLDVGTAVGRGVLAVVRSWKNEYVQPFTGMVPIATGEVAEDLARYLVDSEQTQSALGLGVSISKDLSIKAAGGFLIQVLPFAEDETIEALERNISAAGSVTDMLARGMGAADISKQLLKGLGGSDTGFQLTPRYGPCEPADLQDRMKQAVALLGADEVRSIMQEQGKIEVTCDFCRQTYQFKEDEVMAYL